MKFIFILIFIYCSYYTFKLGVSVWKQGKKIRGIFINLLAIFIVSLSYWVFIIISK